MGCSFDIVVKNGDERVQNGVYVCVYVCKTMYVGIGWNWCGADMQLLSVTSSCLDRLGTW